LNICGQAKLYGCTKQKDMADETTELIKSGDYKLFVPEILYTTGVFNEKEKELLS